MFQAELHDGLIPPTRGHSYSRSLSHFGNAPLEAQPHDRFVASFRRLDYSLIHIGSASLPT